MQARYGVLYHEYRPRFCFWEAVMLLRRVVLLGVFGSVATNNGLPAAKLALALTVAALLVVQFLARPFVESRNNQLEAIGLLLLLLLIAVNSQSGSANQSRLAATTTFALLITGALALLTPVLYELFKQLRNIWRRREARLSQARSPLEIALLPRTTHSASSSSSAVESGSDSDGSSDDVNKSADDGGPHGTP
jgi:hypothetical protein